MSEKKKKQNIFLRAGTGIAHRFVEVRQELKRVIWPTKEKLMQVTAIVLVVIFAFAILLSIAGQGTKYILDKIGFYKQASSTTAATTTAATTAPTITEASGTTEASVTVSQNTNASGTVSTETTIP
jgi:preprotein translocase SecE subunit